MPVLRAEQLTRTFGDKVAVDRLDLEVDEGEVLGFLGPNGAGKTTTIRMLTCLIAPSSGRAEVAGHDVRTGADAIRRSVGLLTETPGLYERLSTRRNLELFARLYGVSDPAGRAERWLKRVDLWDRRDDAAGSLSKGMRQKLAICRALLHEPRIVFLDEPTSALDPEAANVVRGFVRELKAEGRTVFLTTHNLEEADRLCDRIAVFSTWLRVVDTAENLRRRLFGRQVTVQTRGPAIAWVERVRGVQGVTDVASDGDKLLLQVDDPDEVAPRIVRALVEGGADVQRVGEVRHSLEKVYLELVSGTRRPS